MRAIPEPDQEQRWLSPLIQTYERAMRDGYMMRMRWREFRALAKYLDPESLHVDIGLDPEKMVDAWGPRSNGDGTESVFWKEAKEDSW